MAPLPNQVSPENSSHEAVITTRDKEIIVSNNELVVMECSSNKIGKTIKRDEKSVEEEVSLGDVMGSEKSLPDEDINRRASMSDFDEAKRQNAGPCNNFDDSWGECIIGDLPSELVMRSNSDSLLTTKVNKGSKHGKKKKGKLSFLKRGKKKKSTLSFSNDDDDCSISSEVSFSSVYSGCSTSSDYQGPRPVGKDGAPLKSCMKKNLSDDDSLDSDEDDDASSVASSASKTKIKRNISFSSVEIRDYDRAVGDNPCVTSGVPLSLDWNYSEAAEHDLEEYENFKESIGGSRPRSGMQMPSHMRARVLQEFGATAVEIRKASKEASLVKKGRMKTIVNKNDVIEKTKDKLKQFCARKNEESTEDRKQEMLWENAHKEAVKKYLAGDTSVVAPSNQVSEEDIQFISLSLHNENDGSEQQ